MHDPHVFVALYTGGTIAEARLIGATDDPDLIRRVSARLAAEPCHGESATETTSARVRRRLRTGRFFQGGAQ